MAELEKKQEYQELEKKIGHKFRNIHWLQMALRHSSYTNEKQMDRLECNERLEFLGDSVLELVSSEYLYIHYPLLPEGSLTKLRAGLVCEPALAYDAKALELGRYLLLGKGEEITGGRNRDSVTSDAMEALIGAVFMDGGFEEAKKFILKYIMNDVEHKQLFHDSKTKLQEILQAVSEEEITYQLIRESGPDHEKNFMVQVSQGGNVLGEGEGRSKKAAEQKAAYQAICLLQKKADNTRE